MEGLLSESVCKRAVVVKNEPITDQYTVEARPFARGKFATVRRCRHRTTGVEYAAKYMRKRRRASDVRHEILHEAHVLELSRKHPHIVRMHEVYETSSEIILLLELVPGGELQRVLDDEEVVAEAEGRRLLRQILDGVAFLHQHNIAHLDLKPQNLLLTKPFPEGEVKLCDFGISRLITKGIEIREIVGTPDYVAPEVLHYEPISLPTDMWSLGILTYVLLSGHSPFGGDTKQETFCNITRGSLDFPQDLFSGVSNCAKDFIQRLLLRNPKERMTADECLSHPWLSGAGSTSPGIQLTLSPKSFLEDNLNQPENSPTRCPSPLYRGGETKDSACHKSSSPKVARNQTKSVQDHSPQSNGNMQNEDTDSPRHKFCDNINQSRNVFCKSLAIQHNGDSNATNLICPPPKVTRCADIKIPSLENNVPLRNNSSPQYNGNGEIPLSKLIHAFNNGDSSCPKAEDALDLNIVFQSKLSPKVARCADSSSASESNSIFQKNSSPQLNGKEDNGENRCPKVNNAFDNGVFSQSTRSLNITSRVETFSKSNSLHLCNGNRRENCSSEACDQSIDSKKPLHSKSTHDQSSFCISHSLKVTKSVCKSSSLQCNENEQENCQSDAIDESKSPQRNGSFRQSPSPGRREQKSRNSVDMMVSQFEGISKRIVFSEDICVDERVGMVY